jgi:hypothetical protein
MAQRFCEEFGVIKAVLDGEGNTAKDANGNHIFYTTGSD